MKEQVINTENWVPSNEQIATAKIVLAIVSTVASERDFTYEDAIESVLVDFLKERDNAQKSIE